MVESVRREPWDSSDSVDVPSDEEFQELQETVRTLLRTVDSLMDSMKLMQDTQRELLNGFESGDV